MRLGVAGVGIIGGALSDWLEKNTKHTVAKRDIGRGLFESFAGCNAVFVCVPAPTLKTRAVDISAVHDVLTYMKDACADKTPAFIRTTVPPGTCDSLASKYGRPVFSMPEFLTERTAERDFDAQPILTGATNEYRAFLRSVFPGKQVIHISNKESETAKYAHNAFGAVKVTYFNAIYEFCQRHKLDYEKVRDGFLLSGLIEPQHTKVPGPDGGFGYGGKCLPKDLSGFIGSMTSVGGMGLGLLKEVESLNQEFRASK